MLVGLLVGGMTVTVALDAQSAPQTIALPTTTTEQGVTPALRLAALRRRALLASTNSKFSSAAHLQPMAGSQTASWQSVGPLQVGTANYGLVTGRITSIALDPSDTTGNRVFVGTNAGGVWGSTNAASSNAAFTPLTDTPAALANYAGASISIGAVSVQPGGTGVLLAGTGDTNNAPDSYLGAGILRSTDNGATWQLISQSSDANYGPYSNHAFAGLGFSGFAWSTTNPQFVVAALASSAEAALANGVELPGSVMGIYYSSDAGATWQLATIQDSTGQEIEGPDMDYSGWTGNAVTAVVWNPIRKAFFAAVQYHGYYESTDGITWTRLSSQPGSGLNTINCPKNYGSVGSSACSIFRGALAVQPVTGDLFALTVNLTNKDQGLWQDKCALTSGKCASNTVSFAQQISTSALDQSGVVASGGFNLVLAAVPSQQDTLLYVGETDLWRCSIANSCAWRNTTNATTCFSSGVALAQHAIAWDAASPTLMYFGNEGGLWRSSDGVAETGSVCASTDASHFTNLNGALGSLSMVVDFRESPTTAGFYLAGLNELGSIAGNTNIWSQVLTGEAGPVAIDANTPSLWYTESGPGVGIHQCTAGTSCYASGFGTTSVVGAAQTASDGISMTTPAPFLLDPADTTEEIVGTCRVWRGKASGAGWSTSSAISPMLDGVNQTACNGNAWIRSLAAIPAAIQNTENYYIGMAGVLDGGGIVAGHIFRGWWTGSSATWTDISNSAVSNDANGFNPAGFAVSSLYADPSDASGLTLYATIEGFSGNGSYVPLLYRTTNGGASWMNLSSNLPDAPATAVVVDPLDSNTVYIAILNGVYSTRTISSCAVQGQNCWTLMGTGLPYAPVTSLSARALGGTYKLTAATYGRGLWTVPLLSTPASTTTMSVTPASLVFQSVATGQASAALSVTVTNTGTIPLMITSASVMGDFSETDNCQGISVAVGASCTVQIIFAPSVTGARTGALTLTANISGGPVTVALSGTGVLPGALSVLPGSLSFGSILVGQSAAMQNLTVANTGGAALTLSTISISGSGFQFSANSCGTTLVAQASCTLSVVFTPTASGVASGLVTVTSSAATTTVPLAGTGANPASDTLSTPLLSFGSVVVGSVSVAQSVTVTNSGDLLLTLISVATAGDYQTTNNCGATLAAHSSCSLAVSFTPTMATAEMGVLTLTDANGSKTIALSGTGLAPAAFAVASTQLAFTAMQVGSTSPDLSLTVTNTGGVALLNPSATIAGDFALLSTTCGATIAVGGNCGYSLSFTPTVAGQRTGSLTLTSSSVALPMVVSLAGTGLAPAAFVVAPVQLNFASTQVGLSSAAISVAVENSGGVPLLNPIATIAGDFVQQSSTCGATIAAGANCAIAILFVPSVVGNRTGSLTLNSLSGTGSTVVPLSGVGLAPAAFAVTPAQLSFPATQIGLLTAALTVTVTNSGGVALSNPTAVVSGDFSIAMNTCGSGIAAGASCAIAILFVPSAVGSRAGTLTLESTSVASPFVVPLAGSGLAPAAIYLSPTQLSFAATPTGQTSAAQAVTVTNSGGSVLANLAIAVSGDFALQSSTCGTTLVAGGSCTIAIAFSPTLAGTRSGSMTLSGTTVASATAALSGIGLAAASLSASPQSLSFSAQQVGATASAQLITLTNNGGAALSGLAFAISGDFVLTSNSCGTTLAGGASCNVAVSFTPTAAGIRSGGLSIAPTAMVVPLSGVGLTVADLSATPQSLSFSAIVIGSSSSTQTITVTNTGGTTLTGLGLAVTGDFAIASTTCGTTLAGGASCIVAVGFTPTAAGSRAGTINVGSSAGPAVVSLAGTGVTAASLSVSPLALDFGTVLLGATAAAQSITITNSGGVSFSGLSLGITGDYAIANSTCGAVVAANSSCVASVSFTSSLSGARSGALTIAGGSPAASFTVTLTGAGILNGAISLSTQSLSFGQIAVGRTSATQTVTITNSGGLPLAGLTLAIATPYGLAANTCGTLLSAGASCTVSVEYSPTAAGAATAALVVAANSPVTSASVALSGAGVDFTLAPSGTNSATILTGQTATYQLNLTPLGGMTGSFALTCTGVPANTTCIANPNPLSITGSNTVTIGIAVATGLNAAAPVPGVFHSKHEALACLLLLGATPLLVWRKLWRSRLRALQLLAVLFLVLLPVLGTGCGVSVKGGDTGSGTSPGGGAGAPIGTYTLSVTASSGGITHSTTLQLVVN
jgi:hypothetical protein